MNIVHNTYLGTWDLGKRVSYLLEGEFLHYCWVAIIVNIEQCFIETIAFNGSKLWTLKSTMCTMQASNF